MASHGNQLVVVFLSKGLNGGALAVNVDGAVVVAAAVSRTSICAVLARFLAAPEYARLHVTAAIGAVTLLLPAPTGDEHGDESGSQKEGQQGANHSSRHHASIGWVLWGLCRREAGREKNREEKGYG